MSFISGPSSCSRARCRNILRLTWRGREKHTHPETHMDRALDDVFNQSGELNDYDLFSTHSALVDACPAAARATLSALGARLGSAAMFALGDAANRNPPLLRVFDRFGARRDEVEFHPAWHELLSRLVA